MLFDSTLSDGTKGRLGRVHTPQAYQDLFVDQGGIDPYDVPDHPGAPVAPIAGDDPAIIEAQRGRYEHQIKEFEGDQLCVKVIREAILKAVEAQFFIPLRDPNIGYAATLPSEFMEHLVNSYGKAKRAEILANEERLKTEWHPASEPFENLRNRITEVTEFASAVGRNIPDSKIVDESIAVLKKTGLYNRTIEKWDELDPADQTLDDFYDHFSAATDNLEPTAAEAGYSAAVVTETGTVVAYSAERDPNAKYAVVCGSGKTMHYCWTHGLNTANAASPHTSLTCTNRKENHKVEATLDNRLGGNKNICGGNNNRRGGGE
jgi:hypothetical protein